MKLFNIIKRNRIQDIGSKLSELNKKGFLDFRGEVEVSAYKEGKLIHYDKGDNTVTIYAKHATMHTLTGENFTSHGEQRSFTEGTTHSSTGVGEGYNTDETILSGQQYFTDNTTPNYSLTDRWSQSTVDAQTSDGDSSDTDSEMKYPFFPTKMLFGTGFEWNDWGDIPSPYQTVYSGLGWTQSDFNGSATTDIEISANNYSNIWSGSAITKARSMNDIYSGKLTTPVVTDTDFAISGAIKGGTYTTSLDERFDHSGAGPTKTEEVGSDEFLLEGYQGIGKPSFIYARRESRFFQDGSEVQLTADDYVENKITFTSTMPEQTASVSAEGIFYPYNGYTIKEAGLFCDAHWLLQNDQVTYATNQHYLKQPYGIMFAKRYIAPVVKDHTVSLTVRWTLYL